MIGLDSQARIWLCTEPTDMRKSFRGLSALVRNQLKHDPLSGQYFVFVNRRKTQMKMLYFTATGYCLWAKRLEQAGVHLAVDSFTEAGAGFADPVRERFAAELAELGAPDAPNP